MDGVDNVVPFKRREVADKAPSELEQQGARARETWSVKMAALFDLPERFQIPFARVISKFGASKYLEGLDMMSWGLVDPEFKLDHSEEFRTEGHLLITSLVRPYLVPEFGRMNNRLFLEMKTYHNFDVKSPELHKTPNNLLQEFVKYTLSFGTVGNSNLMRFGLAILAALVEDYDLSFVEADVINDCYTATFLHQPRNMYCTFKFDFLPILLDDVALKYCQQPDFEPK